VHQKRYLIVKCPKCGMHTFYSPIKKAVRRRRKCPYCGYKFEIKQNVIISGPHDAQETRQIISNLNAQFLKKDHVGMTIGHSFLKKIGEVVGEKAETSFSGGSDTNFFEKKSDGHQGYPPMTNDQGGGVRRGGEGGRGAGVRFRPEVDWVQLSGHFTDPYVFEYLGGDVLKGTVTKNFGFGSITVYSSGAFDIRFDASDPANIEMLNGIIAAIKKATGSEAYFDVTGYEATIQIDVDEDLGHKITRTLDREQEAQIAWFDIMPYLKVYRKGRTDKYRLESSEFKRIIEGINDFIAEKMPHSVQRNNTMAVMIMNPINDRKLDQVQENINGIQQEIVKITEVLDNLVTYVTNHSERMAEEHNLIIQQNREILSKLDSLRTVSTELDNAILRILGEGKSIEEIAAELNVSYSTCYYHLRNLEMKGLVRVSISRTGRRGRPVKKFRRIDS